MQQKQLTEYLEKISLWLSLKKESLKKKSDRICAEQLWNMNCKWGLDVRKASQDTVMDKKEEERNRWPRRNSSFTNEDGENESKNSYLFPNPIYPWKDLKKNEKKQWLEGQDLIDS